MKKLENLKGLENQVKVYVPSTIEVNAELSQNEITKYIDSTLNLLSNLFGGATSQEGFGAWVSDKLGLVKEKVNICYAYADELTDESIDSIINHCEELKSELSQEAIALEINNKLYFI